MIRLVFIILFAPIFLSAQVLMTGSGSSTTNFNTLASTGTGIAWVNNTTIPNWYTQRTGTGTTYSTTTGTASAGDMYSYGSASASDRSLGSIGSGNAAAGHFAYGQLFKNTSGVTLVSIIISYTGEQWRNSAAAAQSLSFYYKISSSIITNLNPNSNSGWTAVPALNFTSPITGGTAGAINGNLAANKTAISSTLGCIELKNNEYIMIKWDDPDHTGNDHGLTIDDVTVSWNIPVCDAANLAIYNPSSVSGLNNSCSSDASGWIYYSDKCDVGQLLFGIKKNGSVFDASVDLTMSNSNILKTSSNGTNQEHGMVIMQKYWNVNLLSGSITNPVDVRFFYDPGTLGSAEIDRDVLINALPSTSLAVSSGTTAEWFKNTNGVPFDVTYISGIVGNKFPSTYMKFPSPSFGTLNGVTYVELTGITSFSGGSGAFSYGPPNPSGGNALPVTWGEIKATSVPNGYKLNWKTLSEYKSKDFEPQYSYDGIKFISTNKKIAAASTSNSPLNYSYFHQENAQKVYFRIKQFDLEDNFTYSKIVVGSKSSVDDIRVIPYMIEAEKLNIVSKVEITSPLTIEIFDMMGKSVYLEYENFNNELVNKTYTISNLANGRYLVKLSYLGKSEVTKFEKY